MSANNQQEELPEKEVSWQNRLFNRMSYKADSAHFVTTLLQEHPELHKTPHLLSLYSDSFKKVSLESKNFCSDVYSTQWTTEQKLSRQDPYQRYAEQQQAAQSCVADSVNLYLDSVQSLSQRYSRCKRTCLDQNTALAKQIADFQDSQLQKNQTRYFDPMSSDACLSECRAQFYFVYKKVTHYLTEDHGFYVERSGDCQLNQES